MLQGGQRRARGSGLHTVSSWARGLGEHGGLAYPVSRRGQQGQNGEASCASHAAAEPSWAWSPVVTAWSSRVGEGEPLLVNFWWHQMSEPGPLWARARRQAGGRWALELSVANLVQEHECRWQFLHLGENREQYEACSRHSEKGGRAGCCGGAQRRPGATSPARALGGTPAARGKGKLGSSMVTGQGESGAQGQRLPWPRGAVHWAPSHLRQASHPCALRLTPSLPPFPSCMGGG